jgi:hypothetical protein
LGIRSSRSLPSCFKPRNQQDSGKTDSSWPARLTFVLLLHPHGQTFEGSGSESRPVSHIQMGLHSAGLSAEPFTLKRALSVTLLASSRRRTRSNGGSSRIRRTPSVGEREMGGGHWWSDLEAPPLLAHLWKSLPSGLGWAVTSMRSANTYMYMSKLGH